MARRCEPGHDELLRIGVSDLESVITPEQYQNPTVIEFIDYTSLMDAWCTLGHRPLTGWQDVHVFHIANYRLQHQQADLQRVQSILPRLKQLPFLQTDGEQVRLIDQNNQEFLIPKLQEFLHVKGETVKPIQKR
jgi:hypothetical protein